MAADQSPRIGPGTWREVGLVNAGIVRLSGLATGGRPANVFTTLSRHRVLFRRWFWFLGGFVRSGKLPRDDSEIAILRVAHNTGSDYEWRLHEEVGRKVGLDAEEIARVREGAAAPGWSPRRALLIEAADALHADREIGDELWARLDERFSEVELIELCMLVGHYEMLAMTLHSLRVQLDPLPD